MTTPRTSPPLRGSTSPRPSDEPIPPPVAELRAALAPLRALVPDRRVSHVESLRIARQQAAALRDLLHVEGDYIDTDAIGTIARIKVDLAEDIPLSGASFWSNDTWHIHVRADEPLTHRRFTVLHELKHILDHPVQHHVYDERAFVCYGERELIADYFAACALVPEDQLRAAYAQTQDHRELATRFGVSVRRILHRLSELNLTDTIEAIPERAISPEDYLLATT
jgi:Zn-dependent peptidase ImmA (M78 family)